MPDEVDHAAVVNAWLERSATDRAQEQLVGSPRGGLQRAPGVRTETTLGDVTLSAIVDRVLFNVVESFPLRVAEVRAGQGCPLRELRTQAASSSGGDELRAGIRFVIVEFLSVLGSLTAEILTAELHAELSRIAPGVQPARRTRGHEQEVRPHGSRPASPTRRDPPRRPAQGLQVSDRRSPGSGKTILLSRSASTTPRPRIESFVSTLLSSRARRRSNTLDQFDFFDPKKVGPAVQSTWARSCATTGSRTPPRSSLITSRGSSQPSWSSTASRSSTTWRSHARSCGSSATRSP